VEDYESNSEDNEDLDRLDECEGDDEDLVEDLAQNIYDQLVEECECKAIASSEYLTF
jgi:hypothetical protein